MEEDVVYLYTHCGCSVASYVDPEQRAAASTRQGIAPGITDTGGTKVKLSSGPRISVYPPASMAGAAKPRKISHRGAPQLPGLTQAHSPVLNFPRISTA